MEQSFVLSDETAAMTHGWTRIVSSMNRLAPFLGAKFMKCMSANLVTLATRRRRREILLFFLALGYPGLK